MTDRTVERLAELWPLIRDVTIVTVALLLLAYEAILYSGEIRQQLVLAYVGLLASPVFLRGDRRARSDGTAPVPEAHEVDR